MALTDASKLSIGVLKLGAQELVTPVLAKTQFLKFYQPHMGKQKPKLPKCLRKLGTVYTREFVQV